MRSLHESVIVITNMTGGDPWHLLIKFMLVYVLTLKIYINYLVFTEIVMRENLNNNFFICIICSSYLCSSKSYRKFL